MLAVQKGRRHTLPAAPEMLPGEPVYKRPPPSRRHGKPLSDFIMIIPKLRTRPQHLIQDTIGKIESLLERHAKLVVFADLNLKLNVLWVIVRPHPGVCCNLPVEINEAVPDALLVAQPAC